MHLESYLSQHKTLCDELTAIGRPIPEDRKAFGCQMVQDPTNKCLQQ